MRYLLTAFFTFFFALTSQADSSDWQLEKEDDDIGLKIYTRSVEGSNLKEFKGEMNVNARLTSLAMLLLDNKAAPEWMHNCEKFEVVENLGVNNSIFYLINSAPWPVSDRDAVFQSALVQDPETLTITATVESMPDRLPLDDDYIRIPTMKGGWTFSLNEDNSVKVVYQVHAEPGGSLPSWLANAVVVDTPYHTMNNMLKMLKKDKYAHAAAEFIQDEKTTQVEAESVESTTADEAAAEAQ
jgi:hypothetical protein